MSAQSPGFNFGGLARQIVDSPAKAVDPLVLKGAPAPEAAAVAAKPDVAAAKAPAAAIPAAAALPSG